MPERPLSPRPYELLQEFNRQAREVPELVALFLGDPARMRIYEYALGGDINRTLRELEPETCLFYVDRVSFGTFPESYRVHVNIAVHAVDPFAVYRWLVEGRSLASGADDQPLVNSTFIHGYDIMKEPEFVMLQAPVMGDHSFDLWQFQTTFGWRYS